MPFPTELELFPAGDLAPATAKTKFQQWLAATIALLGQAATAASARAGLGATTVGAAVFMAADAAAARAAIKAASFIPVRQTVLSGPVDTSGLPSFGGATGSATVTAAGTLTVTAANGFDAIGPVDRVGQITNPSWTGLSTNGTMYLYLDIASDGTCATGKSTLAPTYRWGGANVNTNDQFTFNIQEMIGKVGTGAAANQTYRVFVGEVTVAGGVVTAITWYALQGRAYLRDSGVPTSARISKNHNIGAAPQIFSSYLECQVSDLGYAVLDQVAMNSLGGAAGAVTIATSSDRLSVGVISSTAALSMASKTTGSFVAYNAASWDTIFIAQRGW